MRFLLVELFVILCNLVLLTQTYEYKMMKLIYKIEKDFNQVKNEKCFFSSLKLSAKIH